MRPRIDRCLITAACLLCAATTEAAPSQSSQAPMLDVPVPCPEVANAVRRVLRDCSIGDAHDKPSVPPPGIKPTSPPRSDTDTPRETSLRNGHFDAQGGTGLIPAGRLGWREIGSWRDMRRARGDRQVPQ